MADQLNMGALNLADKQGVQRASYIPPHMRGQPGGPAPGPPAANGAPPMNGGINGSAWNAPAAP